MTDHEVTILVAVLGIAATIGGVILASKLTRSHARKQKSWELDLENAKKIEELAGKIAERLESPNLIEKETELAMQLLARYTLCMGVFRKYKKLNQDMRNFQNAALRVINSFRHHEDFRPDQKDLRKTFDELSKACDSVLKGKGK